MKTKTIPQEVFERWSSLATLTLCRACFLLASLTIGIGSQSAMAQVLVEDGIVAGSIAVVGEEDNWTFTANANDAVHIRVVETGGNTSFSPYITLYNPDSSVEGIVNGGSLTAALDCHSTSSSCRLDFSGTYQLSIRDDGNAFLGDYEVHLLRIPHSNENGSLVNDSTVTGALTSGDVDSFTFTANAGEAAHIRVVETNGDTSFEPDVWLYNPDGTLEAYRQGSNLVAAHDCYSTSSSCRLDQTGLYRIVIQDDGNFYPGDYEIHFALIPYSNEEGSLVTDTLATGQIDTGDIDTFSFTANAGEAAHIRVVETGGDTSFEPDVWLYNPDGTLERYSQGSNLVAAHDCHSASSSCRLDQTGEYKILIQDDGNFYSGTYEIHFSHMPFADENGRVVNNGIVSGDISIGDIDSFTFEANAGEGAHIRVVETGGDTSFEPDVWLYNPDGTLERYAQGSGLVAAHDCHSTSSSCRLDQAGVYRLLVQDDGNGFGGSYEIHFNRMPFANENGALKNGAKVSGDISVGDIDSFTFDAEAGDSVHITVVETGTLGNFEPDFWLYNPDGSLERYTFGGSLSAGLRCYATSSVCQLNQTGTYQILIQDDGNFHAGDYEVHFAHLPYATEGGFLNANAPVAGSLSPGDLDTYAFRANAGESVTITVTETGLLGDFSPDFSVYNPDGSLERYVFGGPTVASVDCMPGTSTCKLNESGIYRIVIHDDGYFYPSDYEVTFTGPAQPASYVTDFQWPMYPFSSPPTVTQDFACADCFSTINPHHAGIDLTSSVDPVVYAPADGKVVTSFGGCSAGSSTGCGSGLGNYLIVDHGFGVHSLFAHLKPSSLLVTTGDVTRGQALAEFGNTGNSFGPHLHWELKNHPGLTDNTNSTIGYTPNHPINHGYYDPWQILAATKIDPVVVKITNSAGVYVREGPSTSETMITEVSLNQRFVAVAQLSDGADTWYRIDIPCEGAGTCTGWIAGSVGGTQFSEELATADYVQVVSSGLAAVNVRDGAGGSVLDNAYAQQHFAVRSTQAPSQACSSKWYRVNTPLSSQANDGWICGDYLQLTDPPGCF